MHFSEVFKIENTIILSLVPADLKAEFEKIVKPDSFPEPAEIENDVLRLCAFIAEQIKGLSYVKHEKTLSTYNRNLAIMLEFEKVVWKRTILFTDIDIEFYYKWKEFVIEKHEFCNNTINKHTGILKLFMGEAADKSLHQNFLYKSSKFSTPRNDVDSMFLFDNQGVMLAMVTPQEGQRGTGHPA